MKAICSPNHASTTYVIGEEIGRGSFGIVRRARVHRAATTTEQHGLTSTFARSPSSAAQEASSPSVEWVAIKRVEDTAIYEAELANLRRVTDRCLPTARLVRVVDAFIINGGGKDNITTTITPHGIDGEEDKDKKGDQDGASASTTTVTTTTTTSPHGHHHYLIMTPLARTDIQALVTHEPKSYHLVDVARWCLDTAQALHALHREANLYHGDVRPRNVLIGYDGHAYLADLGISTHNHPYGVNNLGQLLYTKSVSVAPEMLQGNKDFDAAADTWSWGVMVEALLSRSLSRCQTTGQPQVGIMHEFFLNLWAGTREYEEWYQALQSQ